MADITLRNIRKQYDNGFEAVQSVSLEIANGEFVVLVGPSGCGKTTTLRMIAGLEEISAGDLLFDGERVNDTEPKDRDVGMVFQNYALYPHLTVFENIAFPLSVKKTAKSEIEKRVRDVAEMLELSSMLDRKPKQLSGGQRQRVALGRAIIRKPRVFLFDEPLSNLDAQLRSQMRAEIIALQRRVGTTAVYVTHDQVEAMTMGDRIVIMSGGKVEQVGTPQEVYNNPSSIFVAGFLGSPPMNFLKGMLRADSENLHFTIGNNFAISVPLTLCSATIPSEPMPATLGIRPEHIAPEPFSGSEHSFEAKVELVEYLGHESLIHAKIDEMTLICRLQRQNIDEKSVIRLFYAQKFLCFFDTDGKRL